MGQLDKLLEDKQRQRGKLLDELKKVEGSIRVSTEKFDRLESDLVKDEKAYEQTRIRKTSERDAHKNALEKLENEAVRLNKNISDINREIGATEQGIKSDLQLQAANENNKSHGLKKTG